MPAFGSSREWITEPVDQIVLGIIIDHLRHSTIRELLVKGKTIDQHSLICWESDEDDPFVSEEEGGLSLDAAEMTRIGTEVGRALHLNLDELDIIECEGFFTVGDYIALVQAAVVAAKDQLQGVGGAK